MFFTASDRILYVETICFAWWSTFQSCGCQEAKPLPTRTGQDIELAVSQTPFTMASLTTVAQCFLIGLSESVGSDTGCADERNVKVEMGGVCALPAPAIEDSWMHVLLIGFGGVTVQHV